MAQLQHASVSRAGTEALNIFMRSVYQWMAAGLGLTAAAAYLTLSSEYLMRLVYGHSAILILLVVAELGLVLAISAGISRMPPAMATGLFVVYSALNGVTLAAVLAVFTQASVVSTFIVCAGMFVALSVYGFSTSKDLTSWGSFLFMGLIGIILALVVNMFLQSAMLEFAISGVGVLVFTGLTAYDTQKLKRMGSTAPTDDAAAMRRGAILGALTLYLDFINLFIMLLHLLGQVRE
jgi:FtsH-binding integral membrane protein